MWKHCQKNWAVLLYPWCLQKNQGVDELKEAISSAAYEPKVSETRVDYPTEIQAAAAELFPLVEDVAAEKNWPPGG